MSDSHRGPHAVPLGSVPNSPNDQGVNLLAGLLALVSNKPGSGVTTLTAMLAMEAYDDIKATALVTATEFNVELSSWLRTAMNDDLRGPVVFTNSDGVQGLRARADEGLEVGCDFSIADAGVASWPDVGQALEAASFVLVVVSPDDAEGLVGQGVEAQLLAAGKPAGLVLNMAGGRTCAKTILAQHALGFSTAGRLPLLGVVPESKVARAVLRAGANHVREAPTDPATFAVMSLWKMLRRYDERLRRLFDYDWEK